jgi:formate hydrogenlyase transcriptional activator
MHYIGMAAMRLPAICRFDPFLVGLSVVFAVLISLAALWITFHFRDEKKGGGWEKLAGAVVMGAAIPVMHYSGMAAASFTPSGAPMDLSHAVSISTLGAAGIIAVTFMVLGLALLTSSMDRRFSAQALELKEAKLQQSEAYLAEAQGLSHTGSFGWRVSTGEIIWSEETFHIFQYDRATTPTLELILQRVHPEDVSAVEQTIERVKDGKDFEHEYRLLMPDGSVKYVHVVAHALGYGSDTLEFVGAVMDVTKHRQAEQKIRQDERELRQIIDLVPEHIIVSAPDGTRLYANQSVLQYYGMGMKDLPSADFPSKALHPDDVEKVVREMEASFARGVAHELEGRARRKDGQFRWFLIRFNPVRDHQGHIVRWYITGVDIHDRKQAEERLQLENVALREEIDSTSMFEEIVGSSAALQAVLTRVCKVAPTDSTVLITGETGTGKELIARAIHRRSERSARAFVSVNCAAIPRDLIASELFGHEKGAFTGAIQRRIGRFELAQGGTIFLDEVGELPAETQIALLRVVQEREYERVGGNRSIAADVRVIAATNRDLQAAVESGGFRSDLFYRLNVFPIEIPALRQRKEDIPVLVEYFIDRYASKAGKRIKEISKHTLDLLQSYAWPGNIRELQNVVERSVIVCDTETFSVEESWLSRQPVQTESATQPLADKLVFQERQMIEAALTESGGKVSGASGAAAKLGVPQSTLDSKIKSLKIDKHRFKPN